MSRQQGRFEAGRILLPNEAPWLADFESELLAFPGGYGPIGLWSGLAVGLAAVALMLTLRLHFCAGTAIAPNRARPFAAKVML